MKYIYLITGLIALILSFVIHQYFMQFIVLGIFLMILYIVQKNSCDVAELKNLIEQHNKLIEKDIEELKK